MKRVVLFLATNIAVLLLLSVVISVLGLDRWLSAEGIDYRGLLAFSAVIGFGGAFISLALSKTMAKWSTGARVIDGTEGTTEYWLVQTVKQLAAKAGIGMPEVAVYEGAPNAFATGAFRNSSLVAVSTGLVQSMSKEEVEAVLGHEIGHVANGDMVTLTLIQGVVNTFVIFLSRVVAFFVDKVIFRTERGVGPGFYITAIVFQLLFGVLASIIVAWFSRQREFRADAASADLLGNPRPMMNALARLGGLEPGALPQSMKAAGITDKPSGFAALFSTHPPVEERIAALQARSAGRA
ncbi:MAG: protease HtpX [Betaproteobacteria bacterium]|nr:protease HtpX [Betaproteobacteria bacterium]